jgi:hypothetical protein
MFSIYRNYNNSDSAPIASRLFNQDKFYDVFLVDLRHAKTRVVIESPFITMKWLNTLMPVLRRLRAKGVRVIVNTKPSNEHYQPLYRHVLQEQAKVD